MRPSKTSIRVAKKTIKIAKDVSRMPFVSEGTSLFPLIVTIGIETTKILICLVSNHSFAMKAILKTHKELAWKVTKDSCAVGARKTTKGPSATLATPAKK